MATEQSLHIKIWSFCWSAEHVSAQAARCQNLPSMPLANTLEKIDILVANSFICRVNPIYPDISGNHPFHSVHRILKRPQSPEAGYVSIIMAMIHNIDILKPACSLDFHKGEIEQIKYTVSWQRSKSLEPYSNYLDMRCITKNLQKWLHMSRCSLWLTENCLRG